MWCWIFNLGCQETVSCLKVETEGARTAIQDEIKLCLPEFLLWHTEGFICTKSPGG